MAVIVDRPLDQGGAYILDPDPDPGPAPTEVQQEIEAIIAKHAPPPESASDSGPEGALAEIASVVDSIFHKRGTHDQKSHGKWAGSPLPPGGSEKILSVNGREVRTTSYKTLELTDQGVVSRGAVSVEVGGETIDGVYVVADTVAADGSPVRFVSTDPGMSVDGGRQMSSEAVDSLARVYERGGHPSGKPPGGVLWSQEALDAREREVTANSLFPAKGGSPGMVFGASPQVINVSTGMPVVSAETIASGQFMPSVAEVEFLEYVIAHEYGHTVDFATRRGEGQSWEGSDEALRESLWSNGTVEGNLSSYGNFNPSEGFGEAWAEWSLSEGRTSNKAARAYAKAFGW